MRKLSVILGKTFVVVLIILLLTAPAFAWGPERTTYTLEEPANHAVFNSITDNPALGDERDFVRIVEKGINGVYSSDIEVEPGKEYEVYIYYDNDASPTFNDEEHEYVGVAQNVRLSSSFPDELKEGERGKIFGRISATNTEPLEVWDEAYITATEDVTLHYVEGSAKIHNQGDVHGSVLSTNMFSDNGTFLGVNELNGVIPCNDDYASGNVVYTIQVLAVETADASPNVLKYAVILLSGVLLISMIIIVLLLSWRKRT